jgi:hypothetical protein
MLNVGLSSLSVADVALAAFMVDVTGPLPVAASVTVAVRQRLLGGGEGEGAVDTAGMVTRLRAESEARGDTDRRQFTEVELPEGKAVLVDRVDTVQLTEVSQLGMYGLEVLIPYEPSGDPPTQRLAVVSFSTPTVAVAPPLRRLFAAIARTFHLEDVAAAVA